MSEIIKCPVCSMRFKCVICDQELQRITYRKFICANDSCYENSYVTLGISSQKGALRIIEESKKEDIG